MACYGMRLFSDLIIVQEIRNYKCSPLIPSGGFGGEDKSAVKWYIFIACTIILFTCWCLQVQSPTGASWTEVSVADMCRVYVVQVRCISTRGVGYWSDWTESVYSVPLNSRGKPPLTPLSYLSSLAFSMLTEC